MKISSQISEKTVHIRQPLSPHILNNEFHLQNSLRIYHDQCSYLVIVINILYIQYSERVEIIVKKIKASFKYYNKII